MKFNSLYLLSLSFVIFATGCFRNSSTTETKIREQENSLFSKSTFELNTVEDLYQFLTYTESAYPLVSAHRGGPSAGYPENAIETFSRLANKMPAIIECDIRLSKDSILVLMHDETLERTTTGKGRVNKLNLTDLKELKLKDPEGKVTSYRIPTLEEALIWGRGKVIFTLDAKNDIPYQLLSDVITKTDAQSYSVVITYSSKQAKALYRINPDLMISASIKSVDDLTRLAAQGIPDNRIIAFIGIQQPKEELVTTLHQHGIKTILGTLGNLDRQAEQRGYQTYAEYIEKGADVLSTDRPFEAHKALDYYIRKRNITSPYIRH
ncbi:glycerophosphodiester phosphodiesterase family protein [Sphingobacterium faecale]|uniref:Glycerophosphodiester phosphodiesterase family protein n=1 Tax=Sphingobacterium faecale TaxID=2803775 RepID=A0ABS1R5Q7_9SPHI|nr:glycerophosphodiester phosphodiesterase family protein [Sphingobacterium faecale]MBL1409830.1 glycerophosphodiester phosphodiesterase family protein [Sphingobacterium faecale]